MSTPFQQNSPAFERRASPKRQRPGRARRTARSRRRQHGAAAQGELGQWLLEAEINVVLFAGVGGADEGIEDAGFPVHVAVNHDPVAIAAHRALNPHTHHIQADVVEVCPLAATHRRPVNILWASPDCTHHSNAKGGAPISPRRRSMPWQICRWVGVLRKNGLGPRYVFMENVSEIRSWCRLIAKRDKVTGRVLKRDGTIAAPGERVPREQQHLVADPHDKGRVFRAWVRHMERLGARYADRDLICADHGVPTRRKRLFGVARFDGLPIQFPDQTHARRMGEHVANGKFLPHRPAAEIIDWGLEMRSIFDRKKPHAEATRRRLAKGVERFVIKAKKPYLVHLTHQGNRSALDIDDSPPTFTAAHRGEIALVGPAVLPVCHSASGDRGHDGQDPLATVTTARRGELSVMAASAALLIDPVANDSALAVAHLVEQRGMSVGQSVQDALGAQTQGPHHSVLAVHIAQYRQDSAGSDAGHALPTVTANGHGKGRKPGAGIPLGVAAAAMVQTGWGERQGQEPRVLDIKDAIGTQLAGGSKHGVIAAHLTKFNENSIGQDPHEPLDTVLAGAPRFGAVGAWLVQNNTGMVGHTLADALSTTVSKEGPQAVGAASLVELRGTATAYDAQDALPSQTADGFHTAVTAAYLAQYYGSGGQHQGVDAPLNSLRAVDHIGVGGAKLTTPSLTPAQYARARQVADFLRSYGVWDGGDLVIVGTWVIFDLLMRMLTPKEAAAAHELRLPEKIYLNGKWRKLTKTEAMRLVGNSVPPRMARLMVEANVRPSLAAAA